MAAMRALVVGGASGIGAACVQQLARSGWRTLVADLKAVDAAAPVDASAQVDVRDGDAVSAAVDELVDGDGLDACVYAAGIGHVAPFTEISEKHWRLVLDVNLTGAFHTAQAAVRHMRSGGALVFISSIDGGQPVSGLAHYCAAKAGVDALSHSIALELGARRIRSNVVAPGPVRTPLMEGILGDPARARSFVDRTPLGAIAAPSQVAAVVDFLLSPAAEHVTGVRIPVDGGMSLREHPSMLTSDERTP